MLFVSTLPDNVRRLRDLELFAACTAREVRRIDKLATTVHIPAGRVLCRRGEIGRECFIVVDGELDVALADRHVTVGRGALIGEAALLTPHGRRTATVTTTTDATVLAFTRVEFAHLMTAYPTIAHKVIRESARRLVEDMDSVPNHGSS